MGENRKALNSQEMQEMSAYIAARNALERAGGDYRKALHSFVEQVRRDAALRTALLEPLIEYACAQELGRVQRSSRRGIWLTSPATSPAPSPPSSQAKVIALAEDMLLAFPLPGGKKLSDATREEVAIAADFYGKQADNMRHKSTWLRLVAQSVSDGKCVRECLTVERLRELQEEARNA